MNDDPIEIDVTPTITLDERIERDLQEFDPVAAGLAALREECAGKTILGVDDEDGEKEVRAAKRLCVSTRTALDAKRKQLKADAVKVSKAIDGRAKEIEAAVREIEDPLTEEIERVRAERKRLEAEAAEAERRELARRVGLLAKCDVDLPHQDIAAWTEQEFDAELRQHQEVFEDCKRAREEREALERKQAEAAKEEAAKAKAALAKEREAMAAERKAMQEERDAFAQERAKVERAERLASQKKRQEHAAEVTRLEREREEAKSEQAKEKRKDRAKELAGDVQRINQLQTDIGQAMTRYAKEGGGRPRFRHVRHGRQERDSLP